MPSATPVSELRRLLSPDRVISDPSELYVYDCDGFTIARSTPGAVVFPTSTEDVVKVVKLLAERDVQIVPRGTGTGLTGGCVAFENGVIVSTARMNKILKIDLENRIAHVEAGGRDLGPTDAGAQLPLNVTLDADDVHDVRPATSPSRDPVAGYAGQPGGGTSLKARLADLGPPFPFPPGASRPPATTLR